MERVLVMLGVLCLPSVCAGNHSLKLFTSFITTPGQEQFVYYAKVDDVIIATYNTVTEKLETKFQWVTEVAGHEWKNYSTRVHSLHNNYKVYMEEVTTSMKPSTGNHTLQTRIGCEMNDGKTMTAYHEVDYDGENIINYDRHANMYMLARDAARDLTKRMNSNGVFFHRQQDFLEKGCIDLLKQYLPTTRSKPNRPVTPAPPMPGGNLWIIAVPFALLFAVALIGWMVYKKLVSGDRPYSTYENRRGASETATLSAPPDRRNL